MNQKNKQETNIKEKKQKQSISIWAVHRVISLTRLKKIRAELRPLKKPLLSIGLTSRNNNPNTLHNK